jgi:hypothetical protein
MLMARDSRPKDWLSGLPELLFAVASFTLLLIPSLPPFRRLESVSTWIKPYYYVNYFDLGFIKRGLIGTIYTVLGVPAWIDDPALVVVVSHALISVAVAILFWFFARRQLLNWPLSSKLAVYSFFLLSPAFFVRLGFDTGRMDIWCLAISIATLLLVTNERISPWLASFASGVSIAVQMLIHDASVLFYSPLIFAALQYRGDFSTLPLRPRFFRSIPTLACTVATGFSLLAWGRYEAGQDQLDRALVALHSGLAGGMPMELTWPLSRTIKMVWDGLIPWSFFGGHVLTISYFFLSSALVLLITRAPWWMYASAVAPLVVSFLAIDSLRFLGISVVSLFLLVLVVGRESEGLILSKPVRVGLFTLAAFFFVFGPWSCVSADPLPLLRYVPWRI